jgi:DNA polymerase-3 subunit beta
MHITVDTQELKHVLDITARISTKHITLPILQCVLLEAKNGVLYVKATNLEIGIEGEVKATIEEDGVIAVPAQILVQTINLITQKTLTLITEGEVLHVETKSSKTEIKSMGTQEFPHIPQVGGVVLRIHGSLFGLGIKTAAFAASQSSIKPELGSIYIFQKREHTLTFVATDSFRLVEKTVPQKGLVLEDSILIPFKNALELARVAELTSGEVELFVGENQCAVRAGGIYITSRLITGTFPDYEQIIPKEFAVRVTALTSDLAHALKKTNIFLNKFMQLTLTVSESTLTLSSESGDAGATTESITATTEGGEIVLNFNQRYVSEIMQHIADDSISLKCAGIGRPMVIENVHDHSLRYLVMPMNK